jgi:tRNA threonylcarbamoyladenosine biosynthesis protein TsaE
VDDVEEVVNSREEMLALGEEFGRTLVAGDLVVLKGELGAGKTTFTQGIGQALGLHDVTSPTFVISRVHRSTPPLVHVDAYRLIDSKSGTLEFDDLDLDTHREEAITVIEWGSDLAMRMDEHYLLVEIDFLGDEKDDGRVDARKVVISKR